MERFSGILMPIFSLPSKYGIGSFSKEAYKFILWLKDAGQSYWQILPTGPTGFGDSPYQSFSVFAGNLYFIDPEELIEEGVLTKRECEAALCGDEGRIDYGKLYKTRYQLLMTAFERSNAGNDCEYIAFVRDNSFWLDDYALFMACKEHFGGKEFTLWDEDIKNREKNAMEKYSEKLSEKIAFHKYVQYKFFSAWNRLKAFANANGIKIIGDIPIYTAADSCDVWADRRFFDVDENGVPNIVAGCPPDGFSADGQLWGNPVYKWDEHRKDGYSWWIKRLRHCFMMYDVVRIDHFRGFDEFYTIPNGETTAKNGKWKKGPGKELFDAFRDSCGKKEIIAEDLGFVTPSVKKLVADCGFSGMKVLQFGFDSRDGGGGDYLPHNYKYSCAAYTGTHDNPTLAGWIKEITADEREQLHTYLCDYSTPDDRLNFPLIGLVMRSRAKYVIIPIQDWLELGNEARINAPATLGGNWTWRVDSDMLSKELAEKILHTTRIYGRI